MKLIKISSAVIVMLLASSAQASLIGDTVHFETHLNGSLFQDNSFDFTVTENMGAEIGFIPQTNPSMSLDIEASSVTYEVVNYASNIASNVEFILTGLDWLGEPGSVFTGATIVNQTGFFSTLTNNDLIVTDHGLTVDLSSLALAFERNVGDVLEISLQPSHLSAVPVPAAVWLFGSGLIGLIGFARRK